MKIEFERWPEELAAHYREQGYWIDQPLTHILDAQVKERPEAVAIICGERQFTYREVDKLSDNLAARLAAKGIGNGHTALVQLPNIAEFYLVLFALFKIGAAPVNALYSHRKLEISSYVQQISPSVIIGCRSHELFVNDDYLSEIRQKNPSLLQELLLGEDKPAKSLTYWLQNPLEEQVNYNPTPADEVAFFQLSGGSTGTPKLIPRTHNDYDYNARASAEICELTDQTRFLCALPAPHNFTLSSPGALGVFHAGGCVVLAADPEPISCFSLIEKHHVDIVALVPSAVILWLQAAPKYTKALQSLKLLQVGGASFAQTLARQVPETLHCKLQQVFGMAEGLINYTHLNDKDELIFTTQGRPISPDDEVKIVKEDGTLAPEGTAGMLATRGPYTFRGYYKSPAHNTEVFDSDGFYYSGDLVEQTPEGYLRVVGRVKDQINRGGEKIASEEIEALLLTHPDVENAALVAVENPLLGEKSCAFIVSSNPDLKPVALRKHLISIGIANYKLPDQFRFISKMPLTPIGKTDKKQLRLENV